MTATLQLTEWERSEPLELSSEERFLLEKHFEATITSDRSGRYQVRPGNVIGSVDVGSRVVVVQPKMKIDRVLFMTAYAADPYRWADAWSTISETTGLVDGMAALFTAACDRVLGQGLLRTYRQVDQDETAIRGRIVWSRQARRPSPLPISVRYQVHDDDILENHVLVAAVTVLRTQRLSDPAVAASVHRLWRQLQHLHPSRHIQTSDTDRIIWSRRNQHYQPAVRLARVILANSMADIGLGSTSTVGFTLPVYKVFEQFVRTALREALEVSATEFPDSWRGRGVSLASGGRIALEPDLGLRLRDGRWRFVGDVKYKLDGGVGHNDDLYQALAYAQATGLEEASLIYALGPPTRWVHHVRHSSIRLRVLHLDLSLEPPRVLDDLRQWATHIPA